MKAVRLIAVGLILVLLIALRARADGLQLGAIPDGWVRALPPSPRVNAPELLGPLAPGQAIQFGLFGSEADLKNLPKDLKVTINVSGVKEVAPVVLSGSPEIRDLKAEGEDQVIESLQAAHTQESLIHKLDEVGGAVAVFAATWTAPTVDHQTEVTLTPTASNGLALKPVTVIVRPWNDWWSDAPVDAPGFHVMLQAYHDDNMPGRVIAQFRTAVLINGLNNRATETYFALFFRHHRYVTDAVTERLDQFDERTRVAFLREMRMAGIPMGADNDLNDVLRHSIMSIKELPEPVEVKELTSPVTSLKVHDEAVSLDGCWGAWMATGDPRNLAPVVNELKYGPDFAAVMEASKKSEQPLDERKGHAALYRIAGWSLRSFYRADQRVTDWVQYWRRDPKQNDGVRKELDGLTANPAFERPSGGK